MSTLQIAALIYCAAGFGFGLGALWQTIGVRQFLTIRYDWGDFLLHLLRIILWPIALICAVVELGACHDE